MKKSSVEKHFDKIAPKYDSYTKKRELHYKALKKLLRHLIPENKTILEVGCGTGDLLAALNPKVGIGYDVSSEMIRIARSKYKNRQNLSFSTSWPTGKFDYIFMSDVVEHLEDPKKVFMNISKLMNENSKFINTMMNPLWEPVEQVYTWLGMKMPEGPHKRYVFTSLRTVVSASGMKITEHDFTLLMPINIPLITNILNKHLEKHLRRLAFIEFFVARKK